ncbi:uncharacterized protein LOC128800904 [Vidua chalybeata]|uniref:uncharacterized protein LOC128800904 n=1 Tax=Vidua chalybeata TaxID=81927 RepID=UPI0023A8AC55|nr:uncharacterized protein LOC128800904 [Vidua chalybeata]
MSEKGSGRETVKLHLQKSATSGVLGAGGVRRVGLVCASGNTQDLPPAPGAAPPAAGKGHGGPGPPGRLKCSKGTSWRALGEGGGAPRICCSDANEDPVLGGGSNIHRIQFLEDPILRGGSAAWRRTQLEEEALVFEGSNSQKIQLSEDPSWRRMWLLEEDLALGSGAQRIQLLEDPVLEGSSSQRRIGHSEDPAFGGYNSWRTQLSANPTLVAPGSWRRIQCSPHRCCLSSLAGLPRVVEPLSAPWGLQAVLCAVPCSSPAVPPRSGFSRQRPTPAPRGLAPVPLALPALRG